MTRAKIKKVKGTERKVERNIYARYNPYGDIIGYSVRVNNVRIHAPGQTRGVFHTVYAARRARNNYIEAMKDGVYSECKKTLNDVFNELYVKGVDTGNKSANTQANQKNFYYNYIEPILNGNRLIRDFTREDIKYLRTKIMNSNGVRNGKPISQGTKRTILRFAFRIFNFALSEEYIEKDICKGVDIPPEVEAKRECLSPDQIQSLTKEVDNWFPLHLNLYAGYYLLLETGARPSEICGLRWCDVDLERRKLTIRKQINRITKKPDKPKTQKSIRTIYITDNLYNALQNVLNYRKKTGIIVKDTDYILTSGKGDYTGKNIAYRTLASGIERLGKRCGIKITSKTFRKTETTTMLEKGYDPMVVARHLGHANTKMIERVYGDIDTLYRNAFPLMGVDRRSIATIPYD